MDTETKSDWTENQKKIIKYYDPERYEKIWGEVKAVVTEVAGEAADSEGAETKKEEESAAE
tara:strand:+ start:661 stop:843 length:183 start_codon:yes stop_codon:yes gene_type:complete